ncbi:MAG: hypothetical protein LBD18_05800 [Treponema sp.]|jgi:hypothetical protein|nr:hypothetical protein [Treponema sp.]
MKNQKQWSMCVGMLILAAVLTLAGCPVDPDDSGPAVIKVPKTWTAAAFKNADGSDAAPTFSSHGFTGVAFGNGVFVAATRDTTANYVAWSADGKTWTEANSGYSQLLTANKKQLVFFLNGAFVITEGSSGVTNNGKWAQSTDGKTWTQARTDAPKGITSAVYAPGNYVLGGQEGTLLHDADLSSLTAVDLNSTSINWINGMAYGANKIVATGMGGKILYAAASDLSAAGWKDAGVTLFGTSSNDVVNNVAFGDGVFIAVGGPQSGTNIGVKSTDGVNWTQTGDLKLTATNNYTYIGFGGGVFLAGDSNGSASWSKDKGGTWTAIDNTVFNDESATGINGIAYGNGTFVMAGAGGVIAWSRPEEE